MVSTEATLKRRARRAYERARWRRAWLRALFVAVPMGYLMARHRFPGQRLIDAVLDVPIVLPPLVVGLSLLILFQFPPFSWVARDIVYQRPAVILAMFSVACAFAEAVVASAAADRVTPGR